MPFLVAGGLTAGAGGTDAVLRICVGFTMAGAGRRLPVYASELTVKVDADDLSPSNVAAVGAQRVLYLMGDLPPLNASVGKGNDVVIFSGETWAITSVVSQSSESAVIVATLQGTSGPFIQFPSVSIPDTSTIGTVVGTATINGIFSGIANWLLADNAGGQFSIDSSTGIVTVAGPLADGAQPIIIAVNGTMPSILPNTFQIQVTSSTDNAVLQDDGVTWIQDDGVTFVQQ